jgi:hypothetical protein
MIKVTIPIRKDGESINSITPWADTLKDWCVEHIGPAMPRGQHNQKRRKLWSLKLDYYRGIAVVMVRRPADATFLTLRWL